MDADTTLMECPSARGVDRTRRRRGGQTASCCRLQSEAGFTIIESVIALGLIFGVLLGLLGTLTSATKGMVTSRQRNVAVGLADKFIETARSVSYSKVGMDPADAATDTANVVGGAFGGEPLAYAVGGADPPFKPHISTKLVAATTYTTRGYVTQVTPAAGDPYKRLTVFVSWNNAQYGASSSIQPVVKLASFLFNAKTPPDPLLKASADARAGSVTITGTLEGLTIEDARATLPYTYGKVESQFTSLASGLAQSTATSVSTDSGLSGTGAGCEVDDQTATCPGTNVATVADDDAGTAPADSQEATGSSASSAIQKSNAFSLVTGASSSMSSKSKALECGACTFGDLDVLPFQESDVRGPASVDVPFFVKTLIPNSSFGTLVSTGASHVRASVDRDDAGAQKSITTTALANHPALDLVNLGSPVGTLLAGTPLVQITATGDVTATAAAGNGAGAPSISAAAVNVCVFDPTVLVASSPCAVGFQRVTVTPGTASSPPPVSATAPVLGSTLTLDTTVTGGAGSVPAPTYDATGATQHAQASMSGWLVVATHLKLQPLGGGPAFVDLTITVNYGQLSVNSFYCAPGDAACISGATL